MPPNFKAFAEYISSEGLKIYLISLLYIYGYFNPTLLVYSLKGAKYTRSRRPVQIIYNAEFSNRSNVCKEENRIKKLSRIEKLELISSQTTK